MSLDMISRWRALRRSDTTWPHRLGGKEGVGQGGGHLGHPSVHLEQEREEPVQEGPLLVQGVNDPAGTVRSHMGLGVPL